MENMLEELYKVILDKKNSDDEKSYTTYLFRSGKDKILKKFIEEAGEVLIASKNNNKNEQIEEFADLIYHMLVLMNSLDITLEEIDECLYKRSEKVGNFKGERRKVEIL
ncbi:MAG: phosphoribosyl-ATP diphosphatase [Sarcina sp.]